MRGRKGNISEWSELLVSVMDLSQDVGMIDVMAESPNYEWSGNGDRKQLRNPCKLIMTELTHAGLSIFYACVHPWQIDRLQRKLY